MIVCSGHSPYCMSLIVCLLFRIYDMLSRVTTVKQDGLVDLFLYFGGTLRT